MKTVVCTKNTTGFGPAQRPNLNVGEVFKCVLMPGGTEITLVTCLVTNDAGNRCRICDMRRDSDRDDGTWDCWINNRNLPPEDRLFRSICTLEVAGFPGQGVYTVFKNVDSLLEEL